MGACTSKQSKWNEEDFYFRWKVGEQSRPKKSVNFRHPLTIVSYPEGEDLSSVDALLNGHNSFSGNFDNNDERLSRLSRSTEGLDSIKSSPLPIRNLKEEESELCGYLEIAELGALLDSDAEKYSRTEISSTHSCQVITPENSGVRIIFPEKCLFPPANKYEVAYKIHTDFKQFTDFKKKINFEVKWEEDEWFIGPVPELKILNTQKGTSFLKHVCIMVPHCVEKELLPYIRVHYFSPESHKYFKVVKRLHKPDTYIPDSRSDPRECFIVTEDYVFIYTTHFTQFVCTCTKKSRLQVVGVLFGSQRHVTDERKQEVNLRLYLGKPIHRIPDFIQGLKDVEKKAQVCRRYIDWFTINLPANDIMIEDRLNIMLCSSEGIPIWKPRSESSSPLLIGDHGHKKHVYFDQLQPCDWCHDRNSPGWIPSEVTRSLIHTYGGRPKQEFSGVCTVEVQKMGESHVVESTSLQFSIDLTSAAGTQHPVDANVVDHLGYAFREVAKELPKPLNRFFARELGLSEPQIQETETRFSRDDKEQTIQYLNLWKNKEGKTASVEQLMAILRRLDPPQNLLADELQKFTTRRTQYTPMSAQAVANPRSVTALASRSRMVQRQEPEPEISSSYISGGTIRGVLAPGAGNTQYNAGSIVSTAESVRTKYGEYESSMNDETHRKSFALPGHDNSGQASARPPSGPLGVNYCQNVGQLEERNDRHESMTSPPANTSDVNEWNSGEPDSTYIESYSRAGYSDDNHDEVVPNRLRSIGEVVEVRDLCRDGSDDDDNDNDDCHGDTGEVPVPKRKATKSQTNEIKTLILTDFVLQEMKSTGSTYVHIQKDLDFENVMDTVNILPTFPNLDSVVLHCGFKYWKESNEIIDSQKFRDQIEEAIDDLDDMYTQASIFISAVLPCRANKNRVKIDLVNAAIEEVCKQTSAQFIDLTPALINGKTGNIDRSMYSGTVSVSSRAANKIGQRLAEIVDNNTDCRADTEVPRKVRKNIKIVNGDQYSEKGDDEHTVRLRDRGKGTQINLTFIMPQ